MAKRIVNKAERNAERYDAKETGYRLFEDSQNVLILHPRTSSIHERNDSRVF